MSESAEVRVLPEVTMTDELTAAIQAAGSTADVKALLTSAAEQELATRTQLEADQAAAAQAAADKIAADQAAADAAAKANQVFTRTEIIGGKEFTFTASTEGEVDRQALNAFKVAYSVQQPVEQVAAIDPNAAAAEAAAAEEATLARTELERKFRLGEISAADYIQQSGAVNEYLASQGVSVDSLKAVVEAQAAAAETQSWEAASEIFRTTVGADWPGGVKNRQLLGDKLAALNLVDAADKVDAMAKAWAAMKSTGAYFEHGDEPTPAARVAAVDPAVAAKAAADVAAATATAQAAETARAAAAAKVRSMSSSLFGASSGTSGAPAVSPAAVAASKVIPDNATPAEILAAYHAEQIKNGIDPNAAFVSQFRGKAI